MTTTRNLLTWSVALLLAILSVAIEAEQSCTICKDRVTPSMPLCNAPAYEILSRCGPINGAEQAAVDRRERQIAVTPPKADVTQAQQARRADWDAVEQEGLRLISEGSTEGDVKRGQAMIDSARANKAIDAGLPPQSRLPSVPQTHCRSDGEGGMYCD